MSESKHTPGPWNYRISDDGGFGIHAPFGPPICWRASPFINDDKPRIENDARLIAAAPDLLEASKKVLVGCNYCATSSAHYQKNENGSLENIGQDCARCHFGELKLAVAKAEGSDGDE